MRILLADDHDLVRETIAAYLASEGFEHVECVGSLEQAITAYQASERFDIVLLDLGMPGMCGLNGLSQMIEVAGDRPVALISGVATPDKIQAAITVGARGFLPKAMSARSTAAAIRFMVAGEIFMPYALLQPRPADGGHDLKPRELEVLRGLAEGLANKEIALNLNLQEVTVKLHVKTLCRKLNARNRTHAAMIARDSGLI